MRDVGNGMVRVNERVNERVNDAKLVVALHNPMTPPISTAYSEFCFAKQTLSMHLIIVSHLGVVIS
jgi:hypothetical protein